MLTAAHRHEEVKNRPSQDNNVVDIHPAGHNGGGVTDTLEERRYFEDSEAAYREHLSESQLHEEHGYTGEEQCQEVGDQKSAAAIFIAEIWKSPYIAKTDCQPDLEEMASVKARAKHKVSYVYSI